MASCRIYYANFSLKNKYFYVFSIYNRQFCSKNNGITSESSGLKEESAKENPNEEAKGATSKKTEAFQTKPTPLTDVKIDAAKQKLKSLLSNITITSEKTTKSLNLAKPVKRMTKRERLEKIEAEKITPEKTMDLAVKAVASTFTEDSEKVESELKEKLAKLNLVKKDSVLEETQPPQQVFGDEKLNENVMSSVKEVADTISESPVPPRSELARRLMRISLDKKISSDEKKSMRAVIEGMVIKKKSDESKVSERQKQTFEKSSSKVKFPVVKKIEHVNLFGAAPLNIFDPVTEIKPESTNTFWRKLQEKEVRLLTEFAPANAFEEMIRWTEQGKHWKFPIDNEAEMGKEETVGFHEHVFLEKHLKGFPTKGPIRHFMELVCVGLSKNPYITVERKIENIEWFRNYFKEKEELLRECGAIN